MNMKLFVAAITLSLLLSGMLVAVGSEATEGNENVGEGIEETELRSVQEIHNWHDLDAVRDDLDGDYVLMNDLDGDTDGYDDLVDTEDGWEPIGDSDNEFTGSFDGDEYEVIDLYINRPNTHHIGLFGYVDDGGEVRNVSVVDAEVDGGERVGGLVGYNDGGTVENSYATGNVSGDYHNVAGLVGYNYDGTVENSYATGNVSGEFSLGGLVSYNYDGTVSNSYATGDVSGDFNMVGGLVGYNRDGTVDNSYATGDVSSPEEVGGLVGYNDGGTVENSYATGNVSGNDEVGGLVGSNRGTVENSFWDIETSGIDISDGGTGKTTAEMKDVATYTDLTNAGLEEPWDFFGNPNDDDGEEEIWNIDAYQKVNDGYPFLDWQDVELDKFQLTVDSTEGGEVVQPGEDTFEYEQWSEVDLEAVAEEGYKFGEWSGDVPEDEEGEKITIPMDDDKEITAVFEEDVETYTLFIGKGGQGSIELEGEEIEIPEDDLFEEEFEEGTTVSLEAFPAEDWYFVEWLRGDQETYSEEPEIEVTMDDHILLAARFGEHQITLDVEGDGQVVVEGWNEDTEEWEEIEDSPIWDEFTEYVFDGTEVRLTAEPVDDWAFDGWTGDYESDEQQIEITIEDDIEITANFEEEHEEEDDGIPGFTSMILVLGIIIAVAIYQKKKH